MTLKEKVYTRCVAALDEKINLLKHLLDELGESASNETKSTAGDKHETALAMLQIEQRNTGNQLEQLNIQKRVLGKLVPSPHESPIRNGSLVNTDKGYFFLSIALGKINLEGLTIIALSTQSPLGAKLVGAEINDTVILNGISYQVLSVE